MKKLSNDTILSALRKLDNWEYNNNQIKREVTFDSFEKTLKVIQKVGLLAQKLNHHPCWKNSYTYLYISITTNDIGGISDLDLQFAKRVDAIIQEIKLKPSHPFGT